MTRSLHSFSLLFLLVLAGQLGIAASAVAQIRTPSGLLLGIYCHSCDVGLHVDPAVA